MAHLVLLGDSVLDNGSYTQGGLAVLAQVRNGDYANPIEPSSAGGAKIAAAIVRAMTDPVHGARGAQIVSS